MTRKAFEKIREGLAAALAQAQAEALEYAAEQERNRAEAPETSGETK